MENIKFKNIPKNEKPRERFLKYGVKHLTNEELLAIVLKTGTKNFSVKDLATQILTSINDITDLKKINLNNLIKIKGIGKVKAITLISAIELGKRIYTNNVEVKKYNINNPSDIINYFNQIFKDQKQEEFYVLYLDTKNNIIETKRLFIGTLNRSVVHPREIFKQAYLLSADKIVCIHNHPSADCTPSKEDIIITKKIKEIALIHDIKLLDHLIIGGNNYYSFYENNIIHK